MDPKKLSISLGFVVALLAGCASVQNTSDLLRPRAAFDLGCPSERLQISSLNDSVRGGYGVSGCERRARYEAHCDDWGACTFLLQSIDGGTPKSRTSKPGDDD